MSRLEDPLKLKISGTSNEIDEVIESLKRDWHVLVTSPKLKNRGRETFHMFVNISWRLKEGDVERTSEVFK